MIKIGGMTVAHSPRIDVTCDTMHLLDDGVQLIEFGGLDHLSNEEALALELIPGDYILTSRLRDGTEIRLSKSYILEKMQEGIHLLEKQGVRLIMMFCTGEFGDVFQSSVPLIEPNKILKSIVPQMTNARKIVLVAPSAQQVQQTMNRWKKSLPKFDFVTIPASPYGRPEARDHVAKLINEIPDADLVVMDCMGFTTEMRNSLAKQINKNIVLPRTLLFKIVSEMVCQ